MNQAVVMRSERERAVGLNQVIAAPELRTWLESHGIQPLLGGLAEPAVPPLPDAPPPGRPISIHDLTRLAETLQERARSFEQDR